MLGFFTELFQKKTLPADDFLPEEKDCYYNIITALATGDFATLNSAFPNEVTESSRVLTSRFELFLENADKDPLPSHVLEAVNKQISIKAFLCKMLKS